MFFLSPTSNLLISPSSSDRPHPSWSRPQNMEEGQDYGTQTMTPLSEIGQSWSDQLLMSGTSLMLLGPGQMEHNTDGCDLCLTWKQGRKTDMVILCFSGGSLYMYDNPQRHQDNSGGREKRHLLSRYHGSSLPLGVFI